MVPNKRQQSVCIDWRGRLTQLQAKKKMYIQTNAIRALLAAGSPGRAVPTLATINWEILIPMAPNIKSGRRPHFSTRNSPGTVLQMLTTQVMTLVVNGLLIPALLK